MTLTFDTSYRATMGARRYQEDACVFARLHAAAPASTAASPTDSTVPAGLASIGVVAVLADGMGGHVGGERASTTACKGFLDALSSISGEASDYLDVALSSANDAIRREVAAEPGLQGMGCTLVGVVVDPIGMRWVSVGDSKLFLFRKGELYQLNEDHSLAPLLDQMVEQGEMTQEQALNHPRRHHLRSALTGDAIELIDLARDRVALQPDDCIVVASDGLDTLAPDEIADLIDTHRGQGAEAIATALIGTIDEVARPGQDNTTVMTVVVRI
jgi:PPM family protein phosphatase